MLDLQTLGDGSIVHTEELQYVYLSDNQEPWYTEPAEVYTLWAAGKYDIAIYTEFASIDKEKEPYYPYKSVMVYNDTYQHEYYRLEFWEEDTGDKDEHIVADSYVSSWDGLGTTYYIRGSFIDKWNDKDDSLGSFKIHFDHDNPEQMINSYTTIQVGYF